MLGIVLRSSVRCICVQTVYIYVFMCESVCVCTSSSWGVDGEDWTRWGKAGQRGDREMEETEEEEGEEIISAMYVFSATRPPLANRTGGHLN